MRIYEIANTPMDYDWGRPGGISAALGWQSTDATQAELWLGAHPSRPSQIVDGEHYTDLAHWQVSSGQQLPYLMKLLAAARPLSLQAHPSSAQAEAGFAREAQAGIPVSAPNRNYKDRFAKPEMILALEDGFEALCGFRPVDELLAIIDEGAKLVPQPTWDVWRDQLLANEGTQGAVDWLLAENAEVTDLLGAIAEASALDPDRFYVAARLGAEFPNDPGIAVGLMLNYVRLGAFEALWLPARSVHAYLSGLGVELMGPSDNVLRGGLTTKHVDPEELSQVLDFRSSYPALLAPCAGPGASQVFQPALAPGGEAAHFELWHVMGDTSLALSGPAIGLVLEGAFDVTAGIAAAQFERGQAFFIDTSGQASFVGEGQLAIAVGVNS